jgi:hypothetical protein
MGPLMRTAIEYTFKRLPKLSMYVTNGSWHIDNNGVENAIRPLAIGRLCVAQHNLPYVGKLVMLAS